MNRRNFLSALIGAPVIAAATPQMPVLKLMPWQEEMLRVMLSGQPVVFAPPRRAAPIYYDPWNEIRVARRLMEQGLEVVEVRLTKASRALANQLPVINRNRAAVGLGPLFDLPGGWTSARNPVN